MNRVEFDSTKKPLDELLRKARDGLIQLPDFQRGWVWDERGNSQSLGLHFTLLSRRRPDDASDWRRGAI
jgi:hypothetical protein